MNLDKLISEVNEVTKRFISENMEKVDAMSLRLDPRSASRLYVNTECIAVEVRYDSSLQYYGGFEYIDKEQRIQIGEYVFYATEPENYDSEYEGRVAEHIRFWKEK